ncbi:hypothetical protein LCGC14_1112230, partial [marine sediment metagenome]
RESINKIEKDITQNKHQRINKLR